MIRSMTGFASLTCEDERATIGLTIRAVNHRFLDLQLRLPPHLADLEPRARALLQKRLARGRVEVSVSLQLRQGPVPQVELQEDFAKAVAAAIEIARERGIVKGELTPGDLLRMPQAFVIRDRAADGASLGELLAPGFEASLNDAIDQLEAMRIHEGEHLATDLTARKTALGRLIEKLAGAAEAGRGDLEARLSERVNELLASVPGDPAAIAQEIVRVAQRRSHQVSRSPDALGRARRHDGTVRPQARLPVAGDESRSQHDRLEGRWCAGVRAHHRGQSRTRADAGTGAECRVSASAPTPMA
jgi:uncharacterized protein (TIGR00255 family)